MSELRFDPARHEPEVRFRAHPDPPTGWTVRAVCMEERQITYDTLQTYPVVVDAPDDMTIRDLREEMVRRMRGGPPTMSWALTMTFEPQVPAVRDGADE